MRKIIKRCNLFILWLPLLSLIMLISNVSVNAEVLKDVKLDYLIIGSGLEYMSYTEYEPETDISTDTSIVNIVTKFEGCFNMEPFFFDIKGVVPQYLIETREVWKQYGTIFQTNDLKYSWVRFDGNVGYRVYPWLNPYLGLRWTTSRQERTSFILSEPVNMESIETCRALLASAGLKGILNHFPQWEFGYSFEYFVPISAHTENTTLTGWKSSKKNGYSICARAVARYIYSPLISFYYEVSGEKKHWDGSGWIDYPGGSAKWPENDTRSINHILGIAWFF